MSKSDVSFLLKSANVAGCTIKKHAGLIAVFGGALTKKEEWALTPLAKSWRDSFVRWASANKVAWHDILLRPEDYTDWSNFSTYSDLLKFEADLGYLTSVVVIFLEAPGSIAELGAFSQIDSLRDRLVVVVQNDYHPKASFISLGPLRQLETEFNSDSVCVIPKASGVDCYDLTADMNVVVDALDKKLKATRASDRRAFNPQHSRHQFTLALDAISLLEAATATDISEVFKHFGITLTTQRISQILFTLVRTGLTKYHRYSGTEYYLPAERGSVWIDYVGDKSAKFNRPRVAAKIKENRPDRDAKRRVIDIVFPKVPI